MSAAHLAALLALAPQEPLPNGESWELLVGLAACERIDLFVPSGPCEDAAQELAQALEGED
jgi:hypothetical protein